MFSKSVAQVNKRKITPRHIKVHLLKDKEKRKILKSARQKWLITYMRTILITIKLSSETNKKKATEVGQQIGGGGLSL